MITVHELSKIISGGQTGADQGALFAGAALGIPTGGFVPAGFRTETGPAPWLADYGVMQASSSGYSQRTRLNVLNSDGTLIFGNVRSPGCKATRDHCILYDRRVYVLAWPDAVPPSPAPFLEWLQTNSIAILNVAGNRESKNPGICDAVKDFLIAALTVPSA